VNSIAEFKALEEGSKAVLKLTDAHVLYVYETDVYIKDATGAIVFSDVAGTFKRWDVVNGNIYGENLTVTFCRRLRDEQRFDSEEALAEQLRADREEIKKMYSIKD
jgi:hypothetical protein